MSRLWALLPLLIASRVSAQPADDPVPPPAPPPAATATPPPAPLVVRPPSEVAPVRPGTPPLSAGRVIGELALGAGLGAAGFFGGGMIGAGVEKSNGCGSSDFCGLGGAIIGGYIGGSLGLGLGVALAGNIGDETGSTGAAIGGGFLGGLVALGVGEGIGKATRSDTAGWVVGLSAWPATAVVAFNLTRHWKSGPVTTGSLLRYDRGRPSVGIPLVVRSDNAIALSLASGSF
jgi:hypothetical protein